MRVIAGQLRFFRAAVNGCGRVCIFTVFTCFSCCWCLLMFEEAATTTIERDEAFLSKQASFHGGLHFTVSLPHPSPSSYNFPPPKNLPDTIAIDVFSRRDSRLTRFESELPILASSCAKQLDFEGAIPLTPIAFISPSTYFCAPFFQRLNLFT